MKHTPESKENLRKKALEGYSSGKRVKLTGTKNPQYGVHKKKKPKTEEQKKRLSELTKEGYDSGKRKKLEGPENPQYGKPHSNLDAVKNGVIRWWDKFGRENWKGEGNPNWKGGPREHGYASEEYRQACGRVRRRDKNTCQSCDQVGDQPKNRLECHHIDGDDFNHLDSNLVTLCAKCHRGVHRLMKKTFERNGLEDPVFAHPKPSPSN